MHAVCVLSVDAAARCITGLPWFILVSFRDGFIRYS